MSVDMKLNRAQFDAVMVPNYAPAAVILYVAKEAEYGIKRVTSLSILPAVSR